MAMAFLGNKKSKVGDPEFNTDLDREVHRYLSMDTNYAFMITGPWGSGKTYYFENVLKPKVIDRTEVFGNARYQYKCVRVSLFGIETLDQLYAEFLLELYPIFKNKKIALGKSILKILARAAIYYRNKGLTNVDDYSKEIDKMPKNMVTVDRLVICLDDLERKSEKLTLDTLIGFINSLVENGNVKIIILSNEDKIDDEYYKKFKEKVIGITIPFKQNIEKVLESILNLRYGSEGRFKCWLQNYINVVVDIFKKQETGNFRNLIFALGTLQYIFSEILKQKDTLDTDQTWESKWRSVLEFTIAASIEFKSGAFQFEDDRYKDIAAMKHGTGIPYTGDLAILEGINSGNTKYAHDFKSKYFENNDLFFVFPSVLAFVTRGLSFKYVQFENEIKEAFPDDHVDPRAKLINSLLFYGVGMFSDNEFPEKISELLNYVKEGQLNYTDTLTAFYLISYYNEILDYDLEILLNDFKSGMTKASSYFTEMDPEMLSMALDVSHAAPEVINYLNELKRYAEELNEEIWEAKQKQNFTELNRLIESDFDAFFDLFKKEWGNQFNVQPIFAGIDKELFWNKLQSIGNPFLKRFSLVLNDRYKSVAAQEQLKPEIDFLNFLKERLEEKLSKKSKLLSYLLYSNILKQINIGLEKLNPPASARQNS